METVWFTVSSTSFWLEGTFCFPLLVFLLRNQFLKGFYGSIAASFHPLASDMSDASLQAFASVKNSSQFLGFNILIFLRTGRRTRKRCSNQCVSDIFGSISLQRLRIS
ncbi:hypothetical protein OUZ56_032785 [Daphnia magna]|uniref:Uncharacterized protein n=1 Tax=Daphnia magna TaxID=35525 RepID=A0ABQ9ZX43_9CRUS|nr:hypothetical protein OUZ56_032785 [Daphnia magna]